ncbi:MAG: serine protease [Candidatus Electrothrix sp. GW3-4]|uniref:S1 family peptidase n=1 Tax=Candidatus Electrothrix sp. GW3-4 TaxID=3126740 RepID=UPI0030CC0F43
MRFFVMFCCTVFSLSLWCGNVFAGNNIEFLDKELIHELNHGIYEVVTPKLEDDKITYARKLPFEKLDYVERKEKYHSIGTAFFINKKQLMTAEHVFDFIYFSLHKDFFIRDMDGEVYPVNKVYKCSNRRDMMIFDLKKYPEKITPLGFNRKVEIGDTVFSAGNALGEGISYRAGQVASFTPERAYGDWENIRFSSPASPGNSGGPLLNTEGEVVGLIVRKTQSENYNIAVPISELDNVGEQAEFHARNITVVIEGTSESLIKDWTYQVPLPATLAELTQKTQASLGTFYQRMRKELLEKVQVKDFPRSPRFRFYLRNQALIHGASFIMPDVNFRKWTVRSRRLEKEPLAAEQNVYHGPSEFFDMQAIIEKPEDIALKTFLESPKMILDTLFAAVPYFRYIGTDKVAVTSLGEPVKKDIWQDNLGRTWHSSLWYIPYGDHFLYTHCLPYPRGVICNVLDESTDVLGLDYFGTVQEGSDELVVGYEGSLDDWGEYLALGEKYLPAYFQQAEISHKEGQARIRLKDFQVDLQHPDITGASSLRLHLGYANDQLLAEDLVMLGLFPQKGRPASYVIRAYYEPSPFSSDAYTGTWEEAVSGTGDFSGKKIAKGNQVVIQKTVLPTVETIIDPNGRKIKKIFTVGCTYKSSTAEDKDVEQDCQRFFESVGFSGK